MAHILISPIREMARDAGDEGDVEDAPVTCYINSSSKKGNSFVMMLFVGNGGYV